MREPEPNFSESQLQQAVNMAYIRYIHEKYGIWIFAHVPSLFAEFDLGWDTAFHLPWLMHPPLDDHEGCNFFLQYKLSCKLTTAAAGEWGHWNDEYFRFKIPHSTRDEQSKKFFDDYHQWDALKALADKGYPTFYLTNSTLSKVHLQNEYQAGSLLDVTPALDVRGVANKHKHVTFMEHSPVFRLHSEMEEYEKKSFASAVEGLTQNRTSSIESLNRKLLNTLLEIGADDELWQRDLAKIQHMQTIDRGRRNAWIKHAIISSFVQRHIGAIMLWFPQNH